MPDTVDETDPAPEHRPERPAVERRLPGRARPQATALREFRTFIASQDAHLPPALLRMLGLDPKNLFRWRVQLDCDCVHEVLTADDGKSPAEARWPDHPYGGRLPEGRMLCVHDGSPPAVYRDIVDWGEREVVSLPADPIEPRHGLDPQTWELIRHVEPHSIAAWRVTLSCGHTDRAFVDLDWKAEDGPARSDANRLREILSEYEEMWASNPDLQNRRERDHTRRMLASGWPAPRTEVLCHTCPQARRIVAFQRIGRLMPRTAEPGDAGLPKQPSR